MAARSAAPVAALALLALMIAASRDFGATWDERSLQKLSEQIWDLYSGRMSREAFHGSFEQNFGYTRIYGLFVEFAAAAAQKIVPDDPYIVRHYVNAVFGWAGVVFVYRMAASLFGARAAWLAAILLVSMPRYFADSMNNPKDLPFAVLMLAASYYIVTIGTRYPYWSWPHAIKLAVAIALALNVRSMGLMLIGYAGLAVVVAVAVSRERSLTRLSATAGRFAAIALLAVVGGTAFWPWAQQQPLIRPFNAFFMASGFNWGNPSLFMGEGIDGRAVPWYYLPTWLAMTVPAVVFAGMAFALVRIAREPESRGPHAAVWLLFLFPATAAVVRQLSLYDGIRHMLFIVPPMAVVAAAGWDMLLSAARSRSIAAAALVVLAAEPVFFQLRNHPNQAVYFTPLIGGPRGAFGRYDMDYWGNCLLQAAEWANDQAERVGMPLGVASNAWEATLADASRFRGLYVRQVHQSGWHVNIVLLKGSAEHVVAAGTHPGALHRVTTADGTPLCVVLPGPEYPSLQARLDPQ